MHTKVFFHGPEKSTVMKFINKYKVGLGCNSLSHKTILNAIKSIDELQVSNDEFKQAQLELSKNKMLAGFKGFIE